MKKLLLVAVITIFGFSASAQNFNLGISAGLPIGDAGDFYSFSVLVDANYLWEISEIVDLGIAAGYSHSFGKSVDFEGFVNVDLDDAAFLPIGAAARFNVSDKFTLGADLGYGIGISPSGNDGGFYYSPRAQYSVSDSLDVVFAFRSVSDNGSFDILSLGVEFGL